MFRFNVGLLTAFFAYLVLSQAFAQDSAFQDLPKAKAKKIDAAMLAEMERQKVVGLAIGLIQEGKIVYVKGYGLSDRENKSPATATTVFNWASNSKPLAAIAAIQLVERRQLDLSLDVRNYVPEFPDKGDEITTKHLLCHQSGIPHYSNGTVIPTERRYATELPFSDPVYAIDKFSGSPLLFKPGSKVDYSSYAYILLSAVVQKAGGDPFDTQIQKRIAKPLRMKSLQLDVELADQENWSVGYVKDKSGKIIRAKDEANYWKHGAGGYKSNVKDFARWAQALVNCELISKEAAKSMWTAQTTLNGEQTEWGLGFTIGDQGGLKVSHDGLQREAATRLVLYPKTRQAVVVMCNCDFASPGKFSTAVFSALNEK